MQQAQLAGPIASPSTPRVSISSAKPERFLEVNGLQPMYDVLMLTILLAAFAGAALYVRACLRLTRSIQPPQRHTA
jgi:hypothetical protein